MRKHVQSCSVSLLTRSRTDKPYDHVMAVTARLYARTACEFEVDKKKALAYLAHVIDDTYGGRQ
jgi:hypothetical protein